MAEQESHSFTPTQTFGSMAGANHDFSNGIPFGATQRSNTTGALLDSTRPPKLKAAHVGPIDNTPGSLDFSGGIGEPSGKQNSSPGKEPKQQPESQTAENVPATETPAEGKPRYRAEVDNAGRVVGYRLPRYGEPLNRPASTGNMATNPGHPMMANMAHIIQAMRVAGDSAE